MGLFSTLASTAAEDGGGGGGVQSSSASSSSSAPSSATLPTVVQLYSDHKPILLEQTSKVTGYTTMTYQAVQIGAAQDEVIELKNRHANPDVGIWNCHVQPSTSNTDDNQTQLVHSLLAKVAPYASAYCLTVDLSQESKVEPSLSLLLSTLVRHLIEHPPSTDTDPATLSTESDKTKTTSLFDLQDVQFGLATEDKPSSEQRIDESAKDVKVCVMICAILPSLSETTEGLESAFLKKQSQALIIYHLRKFANAINASLCFVRDEEQIGSPDLETAASKDTITEATSFEATGGKSATVDDTQPAMPYSLLSKLWCDLAMGIPVWQEESYNLPAKDTSETSPDIEESAAAGITTALYGPGRQQEDLIESVLLRNANYPGHWDSSKESLWKALPAPTETVPSTNATSTGDEGWLTQLRDSIASALPAEKSAPKQEESKEEKPKGKDAAVSSFFESLLKNP